MDENIRYYYDRLLQFMKEESYKPMTVQELEEVLEIKESADFKSFVKALVHSFHR